METQRGQYKALQRHFDEASGREIVQPGSRLTQERLSKLESIGFAWKGHRSTPRNSLSLARHCMDDTQWGEMYEKLVRYKEEQGVSVSTH